MSIGTVILLAVCVAFLASLAAFPWIEARRSQREEQKPPDLLQRLPFAVALSERFIVLFFVTGVLRLVGRDDRSRGLWEIAFCAVVAVILFIWAAGHPGYRWWRRQNPRP